MNVGAILSAGTASVVTTRPGARIAEVAATLALDERGAVVAKDDDGRLAGIISERDVVRGLHEHGPALLDMPVSDLMTASVVTCGPDNSVEDVMELMTQHRIRHMPVVDEARAELLGVVTILDVVRSRLEEVETDYGTLRTFMATRIE